MKSIKEIEKILNKEAVSDFRELVGKTIKATCYTSNMVFLFDDGSFLNIGAEMDYDDCASLEFIPRFEEYELVNMEVLKQEELEKYRKYKADKEEKERVKRSERIQQEQLAWFILFAEANGYEVNKKGQIL